MLIMLILKYRSQKTLKEKIYTKLLQIQLDFYFILCAFISHIFYNEQVPLL